MPQRSRANTARSYVSDRETVESVPPVEPRPSIRGNRALSSRYAESPSLDFGDSPRPRPVFPRSTTFEGPAQARRDISPITAPRMSRAPSDSFMVRNARSNLRSVDRTVPEHDVFADDSSFYTNNSTDQSNGEPSLSPTTSQGSGATPLSSKRPPPIPPARKKPPPPPPPAKKTLIT